jgi:SAM-dependent methyltransferase
MLPDVTHIEAFYESQRGQAARRAIQRRLREFWPAEKGARVLGLGYAVPYLRSYAGAAERVIAAMPAAQGALPWRPSGRGLVTLVEETALPFPGSSFDRILVVHGLETSESQRRFLREVWRVLTDDGRLIVVVPNRTSLWAQFENSPFGWGRPYSRNQLAQLLSDSLFEPERWEASLFMPPFGRRSSPAWDRFGRQLWLGFAGVHMVEASKSLYAAIPSGGKPARLRLALPGIKQAVTIPSRSNSQNMSDNSSV